MIAESSTGPTGMTEKKTFPSSPVRAAAVPLASPDGVRHRTVAPTAGAPPAVLIVMVSCRNSPAAVAVSELRTPTVNADATNAPTTANRRSRLDRALSLAKRWREIVMLMTVEHHRQLVWMSQPYASGEGRRGPLNFRKKHHRRGRSSVRLAWHGTFSARQAERA